MKHHKAKRRHPCEKGSTEARVIRAILQMIQDHSFWARHKAPFAKTRRGYLRRQERAFVREMQHQGS